MKRFLVTLLIAVIGCTSGESEKETTMQETQDTMVGEEITYMSDTTSLQGYIAYDNSIQEQRPGVLVVHEWWGLNDYARERADTLAKLGYTALALDMYGDGKQASHPDDAMKFSSQTMSNIDAAESKFNAALDVLKNHKTTNPDQTAAIGYCFGGGVVLHMASVGADLDAVVSFHGSLGAVAQADPGEIQAKILVCTGADDPFVPQDQVEAFKEKMDAAEADYEVISYEGAKHSFTNPGADSVGQKFDMPVAYNKTADEKSWEAMKELFNEAFGQIEQMTAKE